MTINVKGLSDEMYQDIRLIEDLGTLRTSSTSGGTTVRKWLVECPGCEKTREARAYTVKKTGHSICYACLNRVRGFKHGNSRSRLYNIWAQMKQRCTNRKFKRYNDWGGQGITFCDEWIEFEPFKDWAVNNGYKDDLTLDRIDNEKGYSPDNCRWTSKAVQTRNTKRISKANTSGYRGVSRSRNGKRWCSFIKVNRKPVYLGTHDTAIEAAKAYDRYVLENNLEHTTNF